MSGKISKNSMSIFTMSMLTVAAVLSLRNLPSQAEYGYSVIFYLVAASICFFIPSALVSAELASAWPEDGGVYLWSRRHSVPSGASWRSSCSGSKTCRGFRRC